MPQQRRLPLRRLEPPPDPPHNPLAVCDVSTPRLLKVPAMVQAPVGPPTQPAMDELQVQVLPLATVKVVAHFSPLIVLVQLIAPSEPSPCQRSHIGALVMALATNWSVATLVEVSPVLCVVAVVPLARAPLVRSDTDGCTALPAAVLPVLFPQNV